MEDLVLSCLESRVEENRHLYARFLVGPFLKGDALTVATALRRVLLSSVDAIGITALYIQGITHEFSTIPGVRESVLEISLNFGAIVLSYDKTLFQKKSFFDKLQIGYLQVQGPKVIYANHLKLPLGVKLVDPTQYIATVSKEGSFVLKFIIGKRKDLVQESSSSESHFGHHNRDLSSIGEVGKKNIAKAKKTFFYKNGSTITCVPTNSSTNVPFTVVRKSNKDKASLYKSKARAKQSEPYKSRWQLFSPSVKTTTASSYFCSQKYAKLAPKMIPLHKILKNGRAIQQSKSKKGSAKICVTEGVTPVRPKLINLQAAWYKKQSFGKKVNQNLFFTQSFALRASGNTVYKALSTSAKLSFTLGKRCETYNNRFCKQNGNSKNTVFQSSSHYKTSKARTNNFFDDKCNLYLKNREGAFLTNTCRINAQRGKFQVQSEASRTNLLSTFTNRRFVRGVKGSQQLDFSIGLHSKTKSYKTSKGVVWYRNFAQKVVTLPSDFSVRSSFYKTSYKKNNILAVKKNHIGKNKICSKGKWKFFKRDCKAQPPVEHCRTFGVAFKNDTREKENSVTIKRLKFLNDNNTFKSNICLRNIIPIDSTLTPILKVSFVIEIDDEVLYLRQRIRERIILEVWTNGSVHPRQAVHDAALSLTDMFASFRSLYQIETYSLSSLKTQQSNKNMKRNFQYLKHTAKLRSRSVNTIARSCKS